MASRASVRKSISGQFRANFGPSLADAFAAEHRGASLRAVVRRESRAKIERAAKIARNRANSGSLEV